VAAAIAGVGIATGDGIVDLRHKPGDVAKKDGNHRTHVGWIQVLRQRRRETILRHRATPARRRATRVAAVR
jgi:hypothetical protein